jgi:hypothetical protein
VLLAARRSAVEASTTARRQLHALVVAAPEALRARFRGRTTTAMAAAARRLRLDHRWDLETRSTTSALRSLARRVSELDAEAADHKEAIRSIVRSWRPDLLDQPGVGPIVAAVVLCAWSHPGRVRSEAARRGHRLGCKRVPRLMRAEGLVGAHVRMNWRRDRPNAAPAPDRLNRDFRASRPNTRWVADITEFATSEGKLFLAGIRDLCHRGLVGWAMGEHQDAELVVDALVMSLSRATPDPDGLVHHSDKVSLVSTPRSTSA